MDNVSLKFSQIICPKLGEHQTKKSLRSKLVRCLPKIREDKKKGLHSNLLRFFAQNWVRAKNKGLRRPFVCSKLLPNLQRGGGGGACHTK